MFDFRTVSFFVLFFEFRGFSLVSLQLILSEGITPANDKKANNIMIAIMKNNDRTTLNIGLTSPTL